MPTSTVLLTVATVLVASVMVYIWYRRRYHVAPSTRSMVGGIGVWVKASSLLLAPGPLGTDEDAWQELHHRLTSQEPWVADAIIDGVSYIEYGERDFYFVLLYNPDEHKTGEILGRTEELIETLGRLIAVRLVIKRDLVADCERVGRHFDLSILPIGEGQSINGACRDHLSAFGLPQPFKLRLPVDIPPD